MELSVGEAVFEWGEFLCIHVFHPRLRGEGPEFGPDAALGLLFEPDTLSAAVEVPVKMQFFNRRGDLGRGDLLGGVFCEGDALR